MTHNVWRPYTGRRLRDGAVCIRCRATSFPGSRATGWFRRFVAKERKTEAACPTCAPILQAAP